MSGMTSIHSQKIINVFVHLAYGFGAQNWHQKPGINEPVAYGYHRAAMHGCRVKYSEDKTEKGIEKLFRLGIRYFLKFDFVHAWHNRKRIYDADVVWTGTESQHLAILLLFWVTRPKRRPKLIAQSIWLFDRWDNFPQVNRWLFKKLLSRADVLTVHSPENLTVARQLFADVRSELVLYGIKADEIAPPRLLAFHVPIRLISLGNDEHRDWTTLIAAVKNLEWCELRIASPKLSPKLIAGAKNIKLVKLETNNELLQLYDWGDLLVLALKPNLHASGTTVLQEAALRGIPAVCSDVGGLKAYFSENEIRYVRAQDVEAIRRAILEIAADDENRWASIKRVQSRMGVEGLSSESYVRRHVELSRELLFGGH
jgi:glycosyltransferase involved in cell wall biosynthesis